VEKPARRKFWRSRGPWEGGRKPVPNGRANGQASNCWSTTRGGKIKTHGLLSKEGQSPVGTREAQDVNPKNGEAANHKDSRVIPQLNGGSRMKCIKNQKKVAVNLGESYQTGNANS